MKQYLVSLLLALLAVFAPIKGVLLSVCVLVMADLILGMLAARKRGEKIRSDKLRKTVVKFLLYEVAICIGFIGETFLLSGTIPVVKLVAGLVGAVELKSNFENLNILLGGNVFKSITDRLAPANTAKNGTTSDAP